MDRSIKTHILYDIKDEPWGGGNQFLRLLRGNFRSRGAYAENALEADVILVNSKDQLEYAAVLAIKHGKTIIHRLDGVFSIYRGEHEQKQDKMVYAFSEKYARGVIFQSEWSREASYGNGMKQRSFHIVIPNCSDPDIFSNNRNERAKERGKKIRLITSTWSDNPKKGFGIYSHLDKRLNFDKYEYVFIGRTRKNFNNIKMRGILSTQEIAKELQNADIFITATEDDACSNSLIEAMTCGLPAIGLLSGGTPEIIRSGGELFVSELDLFPKIDKVAAEIEAYEKVVISPSYDDVCDRYYNYMSEIHDL